MKTDKKKIEFDSRLIDIRQLNNREIVIKYDHLGNGKFLIELKIDAINLIKKAIEELNS